MSTTAGAILLSFVLVTNQPNGLTVPEAKKSMEITVAKLNTLSPYKFRAGRLRRIRDPFPDKHTGLDRIVAWNNYFNRRRTSATYIHVFDVNRDPKLAGLAFLCQPLKRKNQVSISMQRFAEVGKYKTTPTGISAAHEIGHQLGFDHVGVYWDTNHISIMDEALYAYRFVKHVRRFFFYDMPDVLGEFGCSVNRPSKS
jgi:hypothetical protein